MQLWQRLASFKVYRLIRQSNRCYSIPGAMGSLSTDHVMRRFAVLEEPCSPCSTIFSTIPSRHFAAPAQFISKPKPKPEEKSGVRINEAITELEVRLVTDQGHRVVSIQEALYLARKLDLDLVEVQRKVKVEGAGRNTLNPSVCKIMDYCKEKYKQDAKLKERTKEKAAIALRSAEVKEVRFKAKTESNDLKIKAESVRRLMERGYRVKCTAMPTGKEDEDLGGLLLNLLSLIEDISIVESGPHLDTRHAYVIVRHIKFAPKKGKKISKAVDAVSSALSARSHAAAVDSNASQDENASETGEEWVAVEPASESENGSEKDEINNHYPPASQTNENSHFIGAVKGQSGLRASDEDKDGVGFNTRHTSPRFGGSVQSSFSHATQGSINKAFLEEPAVGSQSRQEAVESNRYLKGNNAMGAFRQMRPANRNDTFAGKSFTGNPGRLPEQDRTNESEARFHLNSKDRAAYLKNPGASMCKPCASNGPQQGFGVFSPSKPSSSVDQRHMGVVTIDGDGKSNSPSSTYGIFSSAKIVTSPNQMKPRDGNAAATNERPSPKFGTFLLRKASSGDGNVSEKK